MSISYKFLKLLGESKKIVESMENSCLHINVCESKSPCKACLAINRLKNTIKDIESDKQFCEPQPSGDSSLFN